jgi:nucleotide-binding universal stress UspA family protein
MFPIHTILHPTDFSPRADAAFRVAAALARDYQARLLVAHVLHYQTPVVGEFGVMPVGPEESSDILYAKLKEYQAGPMVPVEHHLLEGDAVTEIIELARKAPADLIVLGTHGRRGLTRLLMGSTAELVVRRAQCLVLTVKAPMIPADSVQAEAVEKEETLPVEAIGPM